MEKDGAGTGSLPQTTALLNHMRKSVKNLDPMPNVKESDSRKTFNIILFGSKQVAQPPEIVGQSREYRLICSGCHLQFRRVHWIIKHDRSSASTDA